MKTEPFGKPYAEEQITVSSAVKTFTEAAYFNSGAAPPNGNTPLKATFSVADDTIRIKFTEDPTASIGLRVVANTTMTITGEASIRAFKAIRETTDAVIDVVYFY